MVDIVEDAGGEALIPGSPDHIPSDGVQGDLRETVVAIHAQHAWSRLRY